MHKNNFFAEQALAIKKVCDYFDSIANFKQLSEEEIPEYQNQLSDPNIAGWKGEIDCGGQLVPIIITLRVSFPSTPPRIYLAREPEKPIPHVTPNRDHLLCSIRIEEFFVNTAEPVKIVLETLSAASKTISDGIKALNYDDFDLEFQSYWAIGSKGKWYSIVTPDFGIKPIVLCKFSPLIHTSDILFANTKQDARKWLNNTNHILKKTIQGLYIHLPRAIQHPFPKNNFDITTLLENIFPGSLTELYKFLKGNDKNPYPILFSFSVKGEYIFGGWEHWFPKKIPVKVSKGFRPKNIPGKKKIFHFAQTEILRKNVERLDMERLQKRIGNDHFNSVADKHIMIVGTGSVGSKILLSLASSGISKLTLIDNDIFNSENIARHICTVNDIGKNKAEATAVFIKSKFPEIHIETKKTNFYSLMEDLDLFKNIDLVILATGDKNINHRFNKLHLKNIHNIPCLYTWVEAFGLANHSIIIVPGSGGCLDCLLDESFEYHHRVILNKASDLLRQEAGCNSTFLPFTGLDAELASNNAVRLTLSYFLNTIKRSSHWVHIGDIDIANNDMGMSYLKISDEYINSGTNKLLKFSLINDFQCKTCRGLN